MGFDWDSYMNEDYEYGYDRLVDDSEDIYSYDNDEFDYTEVEKAEMKEWEEWSQEIVR